MTDADEVRARSAQWVRIIEERDADGAAEILDADYALLLVHPVGGRMPRAEWLRRLADYVVTGYQVHEETIDVAGDVALVLQRVTQQATVDGVDRSGSFVLSDCWRRGPDGQWRVWKRHSTPLSAGEFPRG